MQILKNFHTQNEKPQLISTAVSGIPSYHPPGISVVPFTL
jgi:hypothetical protein